MRDTTEGDTGLAQKQRDALRSVLIATLALVARLPEAEELCRRLNVESMLTLVGRYEACSTGKTQSKDEEEDGPPPRRLCLFSESEGDSGAGGFRRSFCEQDADSMYKQWQPALRDRCIRDCEQPRKWKNFVHYTFSGAQKDWTYNQTKTENSPWLSHPLAAANDKVQEALCKKGCGFYYQCLGTPEPKKADKTHTNPELEARLKKWGLTGSSIMPGQDTHGFGDESFGGFGRGGQKWR